MAMTRIHIMAGILAGLAALASACGSDSSSTISPATTETDEPVATLEVRIFPDTFTSVHFADSQTGWVAGYSEADSDGVILATTDGGATWLPQYSGEGTISGLQFVSPLTGWATLTEHLGSRATVTTILHTTDGGQVWEEIAELVGEIDAHFISPSLGRGWHTSRFSRGLLETTDGGQTWASVPTDTELGPSCFDDADRGWSIREDGQVLRTDDGGRAWHDSFAPSDELMRLNRVSIWCDGESIVWIRLFGGVAAGNQTYAIYRTLDAGETWQPVLGHQVPQIDFHDGGPQAGPLHIVDATTAFFVSHCPPCASYHARILRTTDSGATWDTPTEIPGLQWANDIQFLDSDRGWVVGPSYDQDTLDYDGPAVILNTTDGGLTWTQQYP